MKSVVKKIIGEDTYLKLAIEYNKFKNNKLLKDNFKVDYSLYKEHSTIFNSDTFTKVETSIILDYHGIEKGLLHEEIRFRFAKGRIERLQKNLKLLMEKKENFNSQIIVAFQLLCQYYEVHEEANVNIEDFFTLKTYNQYKDILSDSYSSDFDGVIQKKAEDFYADIAGNFSEFSNSRHSIRSFKQELIEIDIIEQVINLATNAPSVCNRQSSKVYLINEKIKVDTVLKIQGGFNGFSEKIPQVLILTSNRNCFYDIGERNQMYVDGGIFFNESSLFIALLQDWRMSRELGKNIFRGYSD